jgi:hypothetical protein
MKKLSLLLAAAVLPPPRRVSKGEAITSGNPSLRVRVTFAGADAAKIKFYVAYLE